MSHTPAPWVVDQWTGALGTVDGVHEAVWQDRDTLICTTGLVGTEESLPNAKLIAAAPDLLSAIRRMVAAFDGFEEYSSDAHEAIEQAQAAIDKAEQ